MNDTIKAKFFAGYFNQLFMTAFGDVLNRVTGDILEYILNGRFKESYLLLRTVDQLTDEEIKQIAFINSLKEPSFERYVNYFLIRDDSDNSGMTTGYTFKIWFKPLILEVVIQGRIGNVINHLEITDYLRSIGIITPFTTIDENNKPVTIPVPELIELGWVRVKS